MVDKKRKNREIVLLVYTFFIVLCNLLLVKLYKGIYPGKQETMDKKSIEIEIWTIHGDIETALNQSIAKYQEQFPELEFKVKVFKNEVYQSAIANAMVTDTLPDIFFCWGYQKLKDYVDADTILDITDYVNKKGILKDMKLGVMDGFTFNGRYYAMPLYGWNASLFCNRRMFEQNHLSYPNSFEEFLEVVRILKEKDIIPISCGGKEAWLPSLYYMSLVLDGGTIRNVYEAAQDVRKFNTEPFIKAAEKLEQLINLKPWQENYDEYDSYNAAYLFTQGKTAMLLTGSWVSLAIDGPDSKVKGEVDVIPFPKANPTQGVGGYVDTYVMSRKSVLAQNQNYINLYLDLMQSIAGISCNELGIGVSVYKNQYADKTKFPTLAQCSLREENITYHPAYDQIFSAQLTNHYYELLSTFLVGEIDSKKFIEDLSESR